MHSKRRRLSLAGASFSVVMFGAIVVVACYSATESKVVLSTDVDCGLTKNGVDIRAAATNAGLATSQPVATATLCTPGSAGIADLGSLVFVPSNDAENVVVQVTLGVTRPTAACLIAGGAVDGCIIARRQLSYVRHEALRVPIFLAKACLGQACTADTTCVDGQCVSSDVASTCVNNVCALPNDTPTVADEAGLPNVVGDSSILGDSSLLDGPVLFDDGGEGDASTRKDAAVPPNCPGRPLPPANCDNCRIDSLAAVCCITPNFQGGVVSCTDPTQCDMNGLRWNSYACSKACQCTSSATPVCLQGSSTRGNCPTPTCGGTCDGTL